MVSEYVSLWTDASYPGQLNTETETISETQWLQ
jgi:hypothetical protein